MSSADAEDAALDLFLARRRGRYLKGRFGDAFQIKLPDGGWSRTFVICALGRNTIGFYLPGCDPPEDGTGQKPAPRSIDRDEWDRKRAIGQIRRGR